MGVQLPQFEFQSPKFWLFDYLARATELEATTLAVGCWHIWDARNDARNSQAKPHPKSTCVKILSYMDMILQHCVKTKPSTRRESKYHHKWTPPPPGEVMVNVNAALFAELHKLLWEQCFEITMEVVCW
jgi:hypothetical protein